VLILFNRRVYRLREIVCAAAVLLLMVRLGLLVLLCFLKFVFADAFCKSVDDPDASSSVSSMAPRAHKHAAAAADALLLNWSVVVLGMCVFSANM
jgi:hypothetical protein